MATPVNSAPAFYRKNTNNRIMERNRRASKNPE
jgi:hypothetical protein